MVDVCAPAVPDPEPSLVAFVDEEVDVEACAAGVVEPDGSAAEPPAEVEEEVPVVVCADAPPEAAWLPDVVVVPVWAVEFPDPAWLPALVVVPV